MGVINLYQGVGGGTGSGYYCTVVAVFFLLELLSFVLSCLLLFLTE